MNHLNLNFLLLLILSGWLIFSLLSSKRKLVRNQKKVLKIFGISFLAIFFISAWFILYKLAFLGVNYNFFIFDCYWLFAIQKLNLKVLIYFFNQFFWVDFYFVR